MVCLLSVYMPMVVCQLVACRPTVCSDSSAGEHQGHQAILSRSVLCPILSGMPLSTNDILMEYYYDYQLINLGVATSGLTVHVCHNELVRLI